MKADRASSILPLGRRALDGGRIAHAYGYAPARRIAVVVGARPLPANGERALVSYVEALTARYRNGGASSGSGATRH